MHDEGALAHGDEHSGLAGRVMVLQRSVGNAAVSDLVVRRSAGRTISRAALPDKDNEAIIAGLHDAMSGWGPTRRRSTPPSSRSTATP